MSIYYCFHLIHFVIIVTNLWYWVEIACTLLCAFEVYNSNKVTTFIRRGRVMDCKSCYKLRIINVGL